MKEPEILLKDNFVPNHEDLYRQLMESVEWDQRMKARKTASFGVSYDYSGIEYPQTEMHPELEPICKAIEKELGFYPNNCLLNYYPDGNSSMGYHSDSSEELAPDTGVAIISLGAERKISYRSKTDKEVKFEYPLKSGVLLFMPNQIQIDWMHSIPKQPEVGERISVTMRAIIK